MRLLLTIAAMLCMLANASDSHATATKIAADSPDRNFSIRVAGGGWRGADRAEIEAVLYAVAKELLPRMPGKLTVPIVVSHTDGNPIALYDKGPNGEYLVQLHASEERWHLYVYEFAHELCHLLSNYEMNTVDGAEKYNQWLEESLCEVSSLFVLKNLAARWAVLPSRPVWHERAQMLQRFYDQLIAEEHRRLPATTSAAEWLRDNEETLRRDPYQREKNDMVAKLLLPLFERDPGNWNALAYLNLDDGDGLSSLRDYLHHWYRNAPAEHKALIADIIQLFRMDEKELPAGVLVSAAFSRETAAGQPTR